MERKIIGQLNISKDLQAVKKWIEKDCPAFIRRNWSSECEGWNDGEKIGFYEKMSLGKQYEKDAYHTMEHSYCSKEMIDTEKYNRTMGQSFGLLYTDNVYSIFCDAHNTYFLPTDFCTINLYTDYTNMSMSELYTLENSENRQSLCPAELSNKSVTSLTNDINQKKKDIKDKENELKSLEEQKEAELEALKRELEEKYRSANEVLFKKMEELKKIKTEMEKQLYVLESEIYAIRCYNGEVLDFTKILNGKNAKEEEPLVVFQKLRYLDEELGKMLSVYEFGDFSDDMKYFEDILRHRKDVRDILIPGEKSLVIVKCSRTGKTYGEGPIENVLRTYDKLHGDKLGLILKNGDNLYIAWADEEKIKLQDENVFYTPKAKSIAEEDEKRSSGYEMLSRYFIFSALQGICDARKIISFPEKINVTKKNPYIIFSSAEGWLEDDTYGTWNDILKRTNVDLKKGDMILTTQRITRDDAYSNNKYSAYNNDRGRGFKNRTHDVSISDRSIYEINCCDIDRTYKVEYLEYPFKVEEIRKKIDEHSYTVSHQYIPIQGPCVLKSERHTYTNNMAGNMKISDYADNLNDFFKFYFENFIYGFKSPYHRSVYVDGENKEIGYQKEYYRFEETEIEKHFFVSEEKDANWQTGKCARANMEIYEDEFINLTFLNSVYVRYVITNRKTGTWLKNDYAYALIYLNKALEYLDDREKEEAKMLSKYMELYDNWQIELSEWRLTHGYHRLTPTRAKSFAKWKQKGQEREEL